MVNTGVKLIVYGPGTDWSWLVDVVNGPPDNTLCYTTFLVLHITTICLYLYTSTIGNLKYVDNFKGFAVSGLTLVVVVVVVVVVIVVLVVVVVVVVVIVVVVV